MDKTKETTKYQVVSLRNNTSETYKTLNQAFERFNELTRRDVHCDYEIIKIHTVTTISTEVTTKHS